MKEIFKDYKLGLSILFNNLNRFIKYQLTTKLLIVFAFLPLYQLLFRKLMQTKGFDYVANSQLKSFFLSPQGGMFLLVSMIFGISVAMIEIGGLLIISNQGLLQEEESSYFSVLKAALGKSKYLIGLEGLVALLFLFLISPFMGGEFATSLIGQVQIPGFIMDVINANGLYSSLHLLMVIIIAVLGFRWMFSMNYIIISEDNQKKFFKRSGKVVFSNFWSIIKYTLTILILDLIVLVVMLILFILLAIIIAFVFQGLGVMPVLMIVFGLGMLIFLLVSFVYIPLEAIRITIMFYKFSGEKPTKLELPKSKGNNIVDRILKSKLIWVLSVIVGVIIVWIGMFVYFESYITGEDAVDITAHRGSSFDAPENTISAIKIAMENGATFVEIDVQETKDGKIILLHDKTLERTTGVDKGPWEMTLDEIQKLDSGLWFAEEFRGEKIPSLQEVINLTKGKIRLNIEIKGNEYNKALIPTVVKLIESNGLVNDCVVSSLDFETLEKVEALNSTIKTGYIMFVALGNLEEMNIDFYSVEETNVTEKFVTNAHEIGREVHVWTINTKESMNSMLDLKVDNIITDYDKVLKEVIKEREELSIDIYQIYQWIMSDESWEELEENVQ